MKRKENIYKKAIEVFGIQFQRNRMMEECAELIQALAKVQRNEDDIASEPDPRKKQILRNKTKKIIAHLTEEVVDVEIIINQAKLIVPKVIYETQKAYRLKRLQGNIDKEILKKSYKKPVSKNKKK